MKDNSALPLVSIITINYNFADATREMLDSVLKISYRNVEVIVVDNGSVEPGFDKLAADYPDFHFVKSGKNLGFAGGNNLGYRYSSGKYILFINNDAVLTEGCLEKLVSELENDPKLGVVSPIILNTKKSETDPDIIQYAGTTPVNRITGRNITIGEGELFKSTLPKNRVTAYAHGCAMMSPRRVIEKAGLIPEPYFLYYEELDWCERMREAGFEIGLVPEAKVYHHESLSVGNDSPTKTYFINRSRILFMRRNSSFMQLLGFVIFLMCFTIPKNTLTFVLRGQNENAKALWRAAFWNLKDAFRPPLKTTTPLPDFDKKKVPFEAAP